MLRLFLLATLQLYLCDTAFAQNDDPFAAIFGSGDDAIETSLYDQAGRDDLTIISLKLRHHTLAASLPAYEMEGDLCLPLQGVFEALEFPIELIESRASGWFAAPDQTLTIDFEANGAKVRGQPLSLPSDSFWQSPDGWCASLTSIEQMLQFEAAYDPRSLTVTVDPVDILPLEARLEREAARREMEKSGVGRQRPDYPLLENPYRWISLPVLDVSLDAEIGDAGLRDPKLSLEIAGDFLKTSARLRTVGSEARSIDGFRLTLARSFDLKDEKGRFQLGQMALGDVTAPGGVLISKGQNGAGLVLGNTSGLEANQFDRTDIRGPLQVGWEAELYEAGQLIAFLTEPDANGEYVFRDVLLRSGFNRFEVRLFGPYGQVETRPINYMIGADLNAENETQVSLAILDTSRALSGDVLRPGPRGEMTDDPDFAAPTGLQALLRINHGLSDRVSIGLDAQKSLSEDGLNAVSSSLFYAADRTYSNLSLATDGSPDLAVQAGFLRRVGERSSLSGRVVNFGTVQTDVSGFGADRLQREASVRLDTYVSFRGTSLPLQTQMRWRQRDGGFTTLGASARVSGALKSYRWTNTLRASRIGETGPTALSGEVLTARSIRRLRVRSALTYDLKRGFQPRSLMLAAQRSFKNGQVAQASLTHDFKSGGSGLAASWSKRFRKFTLSATASHNDAGQWNTGLRLSLALFKDQHRRAPSMASPGLTRSGSVRQYVFHDLNSNGVPDPGEPPIEGVQFIAANTLRPETTGPDGYVVLGQLPSGQEIDLELQVTSLEDPYLKPLVLGRRLAVRAGQMITISTPVQSTGDAEGLLLLKRDGLETAISGVEVEFVNPAGVIVGRAVSEFDGYFYADGLPMGELTARVSPQNLSDSQTRSKPIDLTLTNASPSVFGMRVLIEPE